MTRFSARLVIALFTIGLGACSDVYRPSYDYSEVLVAAVDGEGDPVPGVRLTLYIGWMHMGYGETRPDGTYRFDDVPSGIYGVEVGAPQGYTLPEGAKPFRLFEVKQGENNEVDFLFEDQN